MSVRVLVADDHRMVRQALRRGLDEAGLLVVGEAADGEEAVRLAEQLAPDVVLMDVSMPVLGGVEATRRLHQTAPGTRVVVLSMHGDDELVARCRQAGAAEHLTKDASLEEVAAAVRRAAAGEAPQPPAAEVLSPRELEVLQLVADGCSPAEVGARLFVSQKTVKNHLAAVYAKLGVGDRTAAVVRGLRLGLVRIE